MLGIENIGIHIPSNYRDNLLQAKKFDTEATFIETKIGAIRLPLKANEEDTSDLACKAFEHLIQKSNLDVTEIDCLCLCTQNPDGDGLPHTSAIVHRKLGLGAHCAAFDISLGCSGYVYGLSIITGFMEKLNLKKGVFITADPYSKIIDPEDKNTVLLFGDAATATLISEEGVYNIGSAIYATDGKGAEHLICRDKKLYMNGRQIFNFAATQIPKQITGLLQQNNLDKDDVDSFILHQGSRFIIDTIRKKLQVPETKVPIKLENTGNTVSSSIPLILIDSLNNTDHRTVVLSGFGVGLSWGTIILHRNTLPGV